MKKLGFFLPFFAFLGMMFYSPATYGVASSPNQYDGISYQTVATSLSGANLPFSIAVGGMTRHYILHIPRNYNPRIGAPLILAFHGGMGTAQNMIDAYDLDEKSDKEGFLVAFLNGSNAFSTNKFGTWNAGGCCEYAQENAIDDISFVRAVIQQIQSQYMVKKVFATGMSNGGMLSYRIACELSDMVTAIGAVSSADVTTYCTPKKTISIMHVHALNDDHVLYNGGCGPKCLVGERVNYTPIPQMMKKWVDRNQCNIFSRVTLSNKGVFCELYTGCAGGTEIKLCSLVGGGHSWPGVPGNPINPLPKEPPSQVINATDELWNFFKTK